MNSHIPEPVAVFENGARVENTALSAEQNEYVVRLKKPYKFEDAEYTEIDLSGLENLTGRDLVSAEKAWQAHGGSGFMPEVNISYCFEIAALAVGKPIKFFEGLPQKEALAVKNVVVSSFFTDTD